MKPLVIIKFAFVLVFIGFFNFAVSNDFSERKNFNKLLKGFYKNDIYKCSYINKSWSTGFETNPYGLVVNTGAFKNILVFNNRNII